MNDNPNNALQKLAYNDSDWEEYLSIISDYTDNDHWFEQSTEIVLVTAYCVIILLGILTNVLFIAVIVKTKKVLKTRNLLFMNLAVSDLLLCGVCIPFTVVRLTKKSWALGKAMCSVTPMIQAVDVFVFSFTLIAIASDRYVAIVHATKNFKRVSSMMPSLILIWMGSFGLATPIAMYSTVVQTSYLGITAHAICLEKWPSHSARGVYTVVSTTIQFALPLAVMIPLHFKICRFLKARVVMTSHLKVDLEHAAKKEARYRGSMKLLTAVAIAFLITWFPLSLVNIIADFNYSVFDGVNFNDVYVSCHMLAMSSVFVNPLLYGWFNTNFQRQLKGMLSTGSKGEKSERDCLLQSSGYKTTVLTKSSSGS